MRDSCGKLGSNRVCSIESHEVLEERERVRPRPRITCSVTVGSDRLGDANATHSIARAYGIANVSQQS
jgi:hypothetical protein